jgi:hypothetical protein
VGLDPESLRYRVLVSLRRFRSSWVELGRLLTEVAYGGDYKEWGYDDFEVYCARELGLKRPTVKKLMVSYNYMRSHEPDRLARTADADADDEGAAVPDYQTVELLHRARQREALPEEEMDALHRAAFEEEAEETDLRKRIRERLRAPAGEDAGGVEAANLRRRREIDSVLRTARQLREKLVRARAVPAGLRERFEQLLVELEGLD